MFFGDGAPGGGHCDGKGLEAEACLCEEKQEDPHALSSGGVSRRSQGWIGRGTRSPKTLVRTWTFILHARGSFGRVWGAGLTREGLSLRR